LAVEELVRALDDAARPVREQAAESLGAIGDARAVQPLIAKMVDPASGIATEAAQALGQIGHDSAAPELITIAKNQHATIVRRVAAIEALGNIAHPDSLTALGELLLDPLNSIRTTVLKALSQRDDLSGDEKIKKQLVDLWHSDETQTDLPLIAEALIQTNDPKLVAALLDGVNEIESPQPKETWADSDAKQLGSRVRTTSALKKLSVFRDRKLGARAAETVGKMRKKAAVEQLVQALEDESLPVRENAAHALGRIRDHRAIDPLIAKLGDPSSGITGEAAQALGHIGHDSAIPQLIAVALDDNGSLVQRAAAVEALGNIFHPDALATLSKLVNSPMASIRATVLKALGHRGDISSDPNLRSELLTLWTNGTDEADLPQIAEALSQTYDPSLAPVLIEGLDRVESQTAKRAILNSVGSLLAERDAFYAYLALDRFAADETITKLLSSLMRQLRPNKPTKSSAPARLIIHIKHAIEAYTDGNFQVFADRIGDAVQMAVPLAPSNLGDTRIESSCAVVKYLRLRAFSTNLSSEEMLLMVFILRLIVNG
jgi:HEAT repeat protein